MHGFDRSLDGGTEIVRVFDPTLGIAALSHYGGTLPPPFPRSSPNWLGLPRIVQQPEYRGDVASG